MLRTDKYLIKVWSCQGPGQTQECWVVFAAKTRPQVGQQTKLAIGLFGLIPEGIIREVEDFDFYQGQALGAIPTNCAQCRQPLIPQNIFGLSDVIGTGGQRFCSEACFRLHQEV